MATEFRLPELGENIDSGTVTKVLVAVGDEIAAEQPVIELETDKAVVEVPAPVSGRVAAVHVKEGGELHVGEVIVVIEDKVSGAGESVAQTQASADEAGEATVEEPEPAPEPAPGGGQELESAAKSLKKKAGPAAKTSPPAGGPAPASPSVRRLAREIGVDVNQVPGTGPGDHITEQDVKEYARRINVDVRGMATARVTPPRMPGPVPRPDFARWGPIERKELTGVRRRTAQNMAHAWATVPHVTQFDRADITEVEKLRKQYGKRVEAAGGKLTLTAILLKVLAAALKKFPQFNASLDLENSEIIYKKYYNIGVAVDTDRGLLVPVVRDCDKKSLIDIAVELARLADRARNRKTTLEEMQGGTFSVSNLGGIGGTAFAPIVYSPEVAILGVSQARVEPVFVDGSFVPRTILPLSISYDHRVIDGADGARFLRWVCEAIEQPFVLFLEGE